MLRRRKLLISSLSTLVVGLGLPEWRKPIVSSILLPAHAQTSTAIPSGKFVFGDTFSSGAAVCLEFVHTEDYVTINAKFSINRSSVNFTQGSVNVAKNTTLERTQIILNRDCEGVTINPIDSIVIESYTDTEIVFAIWVEKYLSGNKAYPGSCVFDNATCPTS